MGNATSNEAVLKISTDNEKMLGPLLKHTTNGTISIVDEENEKN